MPKTFLSYSLLCSSLVTVLSCTPPEQSKKLNWPEVAKECVPAKSELVDTVAEVLLSDGDASLSDRAFNLLEKLAYQETPEAVVCAVNELHSQWTAPSTKRTAEAAKDNALSHTAAKRADEFLERVGTKK